MENFEPKSPNTHESENQKLQEDFSCLQSITEVLKEMGFRVIDNLITIDKLNDPTSEMDFPIVRDGVDGIQTSYSNRGGLRIWFTNKFEDPNNPKRQEVERRLKEAGLT